MIAHGRYLAYGPAHCAYCHTTLDTMPAIDRGEQPVLSGGHAFKLPCGTFYTPDLAPDPKTGRIAQWTEDAFVARFRAGRVFAKSHMPWGPYTKMSDDLRAIYRYLRSLSAMENETGPLLQKKP